MPFAAQPQPNRWMCWIFRDIKINGCAAFLLYQPVSTNAVRSPFLFSCLVHTHTHTHRHTHTPHTASSKFYLLSAPSNEKVYVFSFLFLFSLLGEIPVSSIQYLVSSMVHRCALQFQEASLWHPRRRCGVYIWKVMEIRWAIAINQHQYQ